MKSTIRELAFFIPTYCLLASSFVFPTVSLPVFATIIFTLAAIQIFMVFFGKKVLDKISSACEIDCGYCCVGGCPCDGKSQTGVTERQADEKFNLVDPKDLADYERSMTNEGIPQIINAVNRRGELSDEARGRHLGTSETPKDESAENEVDKIAV